MTVEFSSYKDRSAFVYWENDEVFRLISASYIETFEKFTKSGLYERLLKENLIIPYKLIEKNKDRIIIKPEKIIITYPWEWCFSQFKDCALATLKIQKTALEYGFCLKDANFFNIQFYKNKPVLIDTSSFEIYKDNQIWTPYKQFCENFLAPLALITYVDTKMGDLLIKNIDGIPLILASKLLPFRTCFNLGLLSHIHLQSKFQAQFESNPKKVSLKLPKKNLENLILNLEDTIKSLKLKRKKSAWSDYYSNTNYKKEGFDTKKRIIEEFKNRINPKTVIDFGSNSGVFTRIFSKSFCLAADFDMQAVEYNYLKAKEENSQNILPLVFDITNPSPPVGFSNFERRSFFDRINNFDLVLALALMHHLVFGHNLSFEKIAQYFSNFGRYLIIEFVDKSDSKVIQMLKNREDIFDDYSEDNFLNAFKNFWIIMDKKIILNTKRTLYLMKKI